jgi:Co/Zn/Cd efflux system component
MTKNTEVYVYLTITSFAIVVLELIGIYSHNQSILLPDIGHALTHAIIAPWGLYLSTVKNYKFRDSFRNTSVGMIGLVSVIGVLFSVFGNNEHHDHGSGVILLVIAIIGFVQHAIIHKYHDHISTGEHHDILCSGLRWHTLADALKSLIFAGMFFAGLFMNIEPIEPILIWIVRGIIVINGIILIKIFLKNTKK